MKSKSVLVKSLTGIHNIIKSPITFIKYVTKGLGGINYTFGFPTALNELANESHYNSPWCGNSKGMWPQSDSFLDRVTVYDPEYAASFYPMYEDDYDQEFPDI